jgi:uncharacterized membrane-anchored protein
MCPVCGAPASTTSRISANPNRKVWLRPNWNPRFNALGKGLVTDIDTKSFVVDICEDHAVADNAEMRMRILSSIIASIVAGISIFALIYAGADYWAGRPVSPWVYSYLLVLTGSLLFVYVSFRPSALESSFRIIGFDFELQHVWFELSNPLYRDLFMKENPDTSELVTWIVKV